MSLPSSWQAFNLRKESASVKPVEESSVSENAREAILAAAKAAAPAHGYSGINFRTIGEALLAGRRSCAGGITRSGSEP